MRTLFCFAQFIACTTRYNVHSMFYKIGNQLLQIQEHRTAFYKCDIVYRERRLQRCIFIQLIEHHLRIGVSSNLDNDTYIALRLIRNSGNTLDLLLVGQFGDILHQIRLHDTIRKFSNHNAFTTIILGLDIRIRANHNTSAARLKRIFHARDTINRTSGREVRRFHILHQPFYVDFRIIDIGHTTVNHLAEVMRWHIRSHTYGNTACAIHEQVREAARQNGRFTERVVEIQLHIHRILLDITEHLFGEFGKTRFGITHCSCTITID